MSTQSESHPPFADSPHTPLGGVFTIGSESTRVEPDERSIRPYLSVAARLRMLAHAPQHQPTSESPAPQSDAAFEIATNTQDPVATVIQLLMGLPGIVAASHFHRSDDERFSATTPLICRNSLSQVARAWEPYLIDGVSRAVHSGAACTDTLEGNQYRLICVPIGVCQKPTAALGVFFEIRSAPPGIVSLIVQLAAAELRRVATPNADCQHDLAEFLLRIPNDDQYESRFQQLASTLEKSLQVAQVFIATCHARSTCLAPASPVLRAVSGVDSLAASAPLVKQAEEVISEAIVRKAQKLCDVSNRKELTQGERQLCQDLGASRIVSGPLCDRDGVIVGGWILVDDGRFDAALRGETLLAAAGRHAPLVAGVLSLLHAASNSWYSRLVDRIKLSLFSASRRQMIIAVAILCLVLCVPVPYRIRCDCEMQPVTRRFVPAPYEGQLQEVLVKPGDVVSAGQVLARMDQREIEWQLSAQQADYQRASKQHDAGMAARETATSQMAKLEMERIGLERRLLENRLSHLEIRSPIDGVILSGDPKTMVGARLSAGQSLFEAGPLHQMLVEVLIPDDEVSYVSVGQQVSVRLDAIPGSRFSGTIERISPRSESRAGQNVFVADVPLDNSELVIRPGMNGRSRVTSSRRLLGWVLFHKPWRYLVQRVR